MEELVKPVRNDIDECSAVDVHTSLFITHLNETDGKMKMSTGDIPVAEFTSDPVIKNVFSSFYLSYSKNNAEEIVT